MPPPVPPDVVKLPAGTNLGTVSFYDGVGSTDPGLTVQYYTRLNHFTSIMDSSGRNSPLFANPRIDVMSNIFQALYNPPISVPGGAIGIDAHHRLPVALRPARLGRDTRKLTDIGAGYERFVTGAGQYDASYCRVIARVLECSS